MSLYNGKTQSEWTTEISGYSWDQDHKAIMKRMYPNSNLQYLDGWQTHSGESLYDRILPYQMVGNEKVYDTKLAYNPNVSSEVTSYQNDKTQEVNRAFRIINLGNWYQAKEDAGILSGNGNQALLIKHVVEAADETDLDAIEAAHAPLQAAYDEAVAVKAIEDRQAFGRKCVATVSFLNDSNSATPAQIDAIFSDADIQKIISALNSGSLETAKTLITAKDLTGLSPMDATYKTKINGMIDAYLGI